MADEQDAPMDFEQRTEAALSAFDDAAPTDNANSDPQPNDPTKDGAQGDDPNQDPNARVQDPAAPAGELTDEQRQADPQYQQLSAFKDEVENVFAEFKIPDAAEAKLQLTDAQVLYQIASGQAPPSQLLDLFAQNWKPEQVKGVADNLIQWLTAKGFLKDGQAGPAPKAGEPGFKDPLAERLDKFENENKTRQQQEAAQREEQRQAAVFKDKFLPAVTSACKQKGIPEEDHNDYVNAISKLINGNPAILKRIEAGNTVDVQKFFAQVHNAEVARLGRYNKAQMDAQKKKEGNPRIPSGGAPPAPAGSAKKVNVKSREDRIAAAAEML